jgi:hypothetical protein
VSKKDGKKEKTGQSSGRQKQGKQKKKEIGRGCSAIIDFYHCNPYLPT